MNARLVASSFDVGGAGYNENHSQSSMEDGERGKKRERPGTNGEKEVKRRYQLA
jgi:hypothetical protein